MKLSLYHRVRSRLRRTALRKAILAYRFRNVNDRDVLFASYPKSGSTWLTFMVTEMLWGVGEKQEITDSRFVPGVNEKHLSDKRIPSGGWLLRTHERYRPCCKKAIYVVRDGRDVAVSLYFQIQRVFGMEASFSEFLEAYLDGMFVGSGSWHDHVIDWLDSPCNASGNLLLVRYEDMKEDVRRELRRAADFLEVDITPERFENAVRLGSFDSMRKTENRAEILAHREKGDAIPFVRKGVVGDWENHFSADDLKRFNAVARPAMVRLGYECVEAIAPA